MSYIGNSPTSVAFPTDSFSGTGSQTAYTMTVAPANTASVLIFISGVKQDPSTYSVSGTTLTFSAAPPLGTNNISAIYLGIPASGVTTTAYRTITTFTATAGQTTFTPSSYTAGFINVFRNGVLLTPTSDYTATNGTTVVLASGANLNDIILVESFYVSSVLNAIPNTAGSVNSTNLASGLTASINTLNSTSGVLATQNGMTGIAKAWVTFDGTAASPTPVSSFNISSITKNGTGDYTITFSTAMANANYSAIGTCRVDGGTNHSMVVGGSVATTPTTSAFRVNTMSGWAYASVASQVVDSAAVYIAFFGA